MNSGTDWFERLTGFPEVSYRETQKNLEVQGQLLRSHVNGRSYNIGQLELVSLQELRERASLVQGLAGSLRFQNLTGDVRTLHQIPEYAGALFQVASQFNLLEMTGPSITPEHGVTRYQNDHTQGPACAIAAGAATIYRNYFAEAEGQLGQTSTRQINTLSAIGRILSEALDRSVASLWSMTNGYALCSHEGLSMIGRHLDSAEPAEIDRLRLSLKIGVHRDVEVTDCRDMPYPLVSQAFCSALPVGYMKFSISMWTRFATLILEAAYEATLWEAVMNAASGKSNIVLLTRVGGGIFGNDDRWIDAALARALSMVREFPLDIRMVSLGEPPTAMVALEEVYR